MYLGRVTGTVVATQKYEGLEGKKLLMVQPLSHTLQATGDPHVAVDTVRAGHGDLVYLVGSREAALALDPQPGILGGTAASEASRLAPLASPAWFVPVDAAIVGIVDDVDVAKAKVAP